MYNNRVVVYTSGTFDMFHIGHLNVLKNAKDCCEYLIVGVSTDELVQKEKKKTPVIPYEERIQIVEAIRYVDKVVPQYDKDKFAAWEKYHFDVAFIGDDWKGTEVWNKIEAELKNVGCDTVYIPYTQGISTTDIRKKLGDKSDKNEDKD